MESILTDILMKVSDVLTQKSALRVSDVLTHTGQRCPDTCQVLVTACRLEQLIKKGKIVGFRRSEGWAKVRLDPV